MALSIRLIITALILLAAPAPFLLSISTNTGVVITMSTNQVGFMDVFYLDYAVPGQAAVLDVDLTNYDFSKVSIIMSLAGVSGNTFRVKVKNLELSNFTVPALLVTASNSSNTSFFFAPPFEVAQRPFRTNLSNLAPIEDIFSFWDPALLIILAFVLGLAVLSALAYFILKKMKNPGGKETPGPATDPYDEAEAELYRIWNTKMDQSNCKDIFIRISETIRRFLGRVFSFNALEMATSEILYHFRGGSADEFFSGISEIMEHLFRICDRVKFAKMVPTDDNKQTAVTEALEMVKQTKELLSPAEPETPDDAGKGAVTGDGIGGGQ